MEIIVGKSRQKSRYKSVPTKIFETRGKIELKGFHFLQSFFAKWSPIGTKKKFGIFNSREKFRSTSI